MSRNDDSHHNQHYHRHRSSHNRDHGRRSHHETHRYRDGSHHSRSHHDHNRSSSTVRNSPTNYTQQHQPDHAFHHQVAPPVFANQQQFPLEMQTSPFNPVMALPPQFQSQSLVQTQSIMPFNFQSMPPMASVMPNLPLPTELDEKSISAAALERLQLPQDKITETGIIPSNAYYDLPAGLMVPLVPLSRIEYKPINPKDLRLPFPKFPDENFLRMIDSFYAKDSDKRDNDGWDRNFVELYKKQKEALSRMQSEFS